MAENKQPLNDGATQVGTVGVVGAGKAPVLTLTQSIQKTFGRLNTWEKVAVVIAFFISLGFNIKGIVPTVMAGEYNFLSTMSLIMAVFGFLGTWTMAVQWQHTFKLNGVQNVSGILVNFKQKLFGDMLTSGYYLWTEFVGHRNWGELRDEDGDLQVDKEFGYKDIFKAVVIWTIGLGILSKLLGGTQIWLDAVTNGLSFTAQRRQVTGHIDGYYIWLLVDVLSFWLMLRVGNEVVAYSYLGMFAQGVAGLIIWRRGE